MKTSKTTIFLFFILLCTFGLYYSGLSGGYVFDDVANILDNKKLAITHLSWENLKAATWSGDAGPLGRPISMLSFALNYYFTGFDPFYFKLTNICIHLMNGVLVFWLSLNLFKFLSYRYQKISINHTAYLALIVSLIWLIHPLNLTSILYVVQRMTSLSALFGLLACALYCTWRMRPVFGVLQTVGYWIAIFATLLLSVLSKESGLLFVGLIYWIELIVFQGQHTQTLQDIRFKKIKVFHLLLAGLLLGIGLVTYLIQPYLVTGQLANRDFSVYERVLSEARVMFFYLKLIIYPKLSDLSLYHDDFILSRSLFEPLSTLYSIIGLVLISLISLLLVKRYPLILFAWGWFIISQLMESTVIGLELIHEHRNYFATIGFMILAVYAIAQMRHAKIILFMYLLCGVYLANLALTTWQRATIWSNLVDQSAYEVAMHPRSDRSNYQMAYIYMQLMQDQPHEKAKYAALAQQYLAQARLSYLPGNGGWFAALHLDSYMDKPIDPNLIQQLIFNLKHHPFYNSNIGFLSAFANCQINGFCKVAHEQAVEIIAAGLENPKTSNDNKAEIYKLLAQYFVSLAHDYIKGEEFMQDALALKQDVNGHLVFAQIYRLEGKLDLAQKQLALAKQLDVKNIWFNEINIESRNIGTAESSKVK